MARITVQSTGENPSTSRNGMLELWTSTIDPMRPNLRARAGWARIVRVVPRLVIAKTALIAGRSRAN
jgi:hypothetical protein